MNVPQSDTDNGKHVSGQNDCYNFVMSLPFTFALQRKQWFTEPVAQTDCYLPTLLLWKKHSLCPSRIVNLKTFWWPKILNQNALLSCSWNERRGASHDQCLVTHCIQTVVPSLCHCLALDHTAAGFSVRRTSRCDGGLVYRSTERRSLLLDSMQFLLQLVVSRATSHTAAATSKGDHSLPPSACLVRTGTVNKSVSSSSGFERIHRRPPLLSHSFLLPLKHPFFRNKERDRIQGTMTITCGQEEEDAKKACYCEQVSNHDMHAPSRWSID